MRRGGNLAGQQLSDIRSHFGPRRRDFSEALVARRDIQRREQCTLGEYLIPSSVTPVEEGLQGCRHLSPGRDGEVGPGTAGHPAWSPHHEAGTDREDGAHSSYRDSQTYGT
ncbi:hypothetical protein CMUS01_06590 [Colletotrichum musicola]|uniref:Uncharacterized protein n=1 Tax=Colletotrichum musicola TaxID=2175873 RepID=A0A8H6NH87_9PEZI|nr:hypothetical protein CMUS01_06590 [Colletotrichum musicola]